MKKILVVISILLAIPVILYCAFFTLFVGDAFYTNIEERLWYSSLKKPQEKLAQELGVKIRDYPYPDSFPIGYFDTVLKPGMTISEVHAIVKGYKEVYECWGTDEYYFYFYDEPNNRFIVSIDYDDQGKYSGNIQIDSPYDHTLGLDDSCKTGLLTP